MIADGTSTPVLAYSFQLPVFFKLLLAKYASTEDLSAV